MRLAQAALVAGVATGENAAGILHCSVERMIHFQYAVDGDGDD